MRNREDIKGDREIGKQEETEEKRWTTNTQEARL